MEQSSAPQRHHLVQAPIKPVDEDGVVVALVGTGGFVLATLVLWLRLGSLRAAGHGWYLAVAATGIVLGLLGVAWTRRRQGRR